MPLFRQKCIDNVETSGRAAILTTHNFDKYPLCRNSGLWKQQVKNHDPLFRQIIVVEAADRNPRAFVQTRNKIYLFRVAMCPEWQTLE